MATFDLFGDLIPEQQEGAKKAGPITVEQSDLFGGEATVIVVPQKPSTAVIKFHGKRVRTPEDIEKLKQKALRRELLKKNSLQIHEVCNVLGLKESKGWGTLHTGYDLDPTAKTRGERVPLHYNGRSFVRTPFVRKEFFGENPAGRRSDFVRQIREGGVVSSCRKKLEGLFEMRENEPLVYKGLELLAVRLRLASEDEDLELIGEAFLQFYQQEDFLQNERSGLTIRNLKTQAKIDKTRTRAKRGSRAKALAELEDDIVNESADIDITNLVVTRCAPVADQDDEEVEEMYEAYEEEWDRQAAAKATRNALVGIRAEEAPEEEYLVEAAEEDDGESIAYVDEETESLVDVNAIHMDFVDDEIDPVEFGQ